MDITIDYLKNHTECIPGLARYSYEEWMPVYVQSNLTYEDAVRSCSERVNVDRLPLALVAIHKDHVVGTGSLKVHDLDVRPELSPWLGGMYVIEEYRNQGIGSLLIERLLGEAARLDLGGLYLWTPFSDSLYARYGWREIESLEYCGYNICVMYREIIGSRDQ